MAVKNWGPVKGSLTTKDFDRNDFSYLKEPKTFKGKQNLGANTSLPMELRDKGGKVNNPPPRKKESIKRSFKEDFSNNLGRSKHYHYAHTADSGAVRDLDKQVVCRAVKIGRMVTVNIKALKNRGERVLTELKESFGVNGRYTGGSNQKIMFCCTPEEREVILNTLRRAIYPC